jgi:hypothetical protein
MTQLWSVLPKTTIHLSRTLSLVPTSETGSSMRRLRMLLKFLSTCAGELCDACLPPLVVQASVAVAEGLEHDEEPGLEEAGEDGAGSVGKIGDWGIAGLPRTWPSSTSRWLLGREQGRRCEASLQAGTRASAATRTAISLMACR